MKTPPLSLYKHQTKNELAKSLPLALRVYSKSQTEKETTTVMHPSMVLIQYPKI